MPPTPQEQIQFLTNLQRLLAETTEVQAIFSAENDLLQQAALRESYSAFICAGEAGSRRTFYTLDMRNFLRFTRNEMMLLPHS